MTFRPVIDAVSGRSYGQASQTPGAIGGRRDVVQWYKEGTVSTHNMIVKVNGAAWRLIEVIANVVTAPVSGAVNVNVLAKLPGQSSYVTIFDVLPSISIGQFQSSGGIIKPSMRVLPIGTLVGNAIGSNVEALVALALDANPREQSRLRGGIWDTPISVTGTSSNDPRIYPVKGLVWFTTNDDSSQDAWGWGVGSRSKDGGDTWSATPDPGIGGGGIMHVAVDAGGRIWCIVHDSDSTFTRTNIYYSDTDGDSWVLSTTHGTGAIPQQSRGWKIIPHPTDQDTIAIIGFSGNIPSGSRGYILITENRGTSWVFNNSSATRRGQSGVRQYYDAVMLNDGRIIAQGPFVVVSPVRWYTLYSDDFGTSWSQGILQTSTSFRINGIYVNADESIVAYIFSNLTLSDSERHKIFISTDRGVSYSAVNLTEELHDFVGTFDVRRFISSAVHEAMYISTQQGVAIAKLAPVGASGI